MQIGARFRHMTVTNETGDAISGLQPDYTSPRPISWDCLFGALGIKFIAEDRCRYRYEAGLPCRSNTEGVSIFGKSTT
jgi:hypothetical protein